ncbi:MAG TPA: RHS repeat-associated core domain-containing protein, partial [Sedimentisphaerales bacterium]|nr:RHS repeat-associated core domain-containing protein [Sedimentisphaerales bacterium]HRV49126.1 RHS repeat-associated core domain-containing protein [Sedimentisphaerales bacterium]
MRGEVPTIQPCVPTPRGDAHGDTVQVYEYDVYGQVAASDPNHPNRFLFTGREFDEETGLYYYRARYYNPTIGRFLQTDPIGYTNGMNMYRYCGNNATNSVDP